MTQTTGRRARFGTTSVLLFVVATLLAATTATTAISGPADTATPQPATRSTPPLRSFSLVATGDVLTESAVNAAASALAPGTAARYDFAPLFAPVSPGVFEVVPWPVLLCNEPVSRVVYAPITTLADPSLSPGIRAGLQACIDRTTPLVPDVH